MKKLSVSVSTIVFVLLLTGVGVCSSISNIRFSPASPSALAFGQHIDITFDYSSTGAGGIYLSVRPITNGESTPFYSVSESPLYAAGSGSGTGFLTVDSGETTIDQIKFRILDSDRSVVLGEFLVPVVYHFHPGAVSLMNIQTSSPSPASLAFGEEVDIKFDYSTTEAGGIRVFARPITNGDLTPNYTASASSIYPAGSGIGTGSFSITSGETVVDQIRFQVLNSDQSVLLSEFFVPIRYAFPVEFASAPEAPVLTVSESGGSVALSWTSVPTATGYLVGYAPYPNVEYVEVLDVGAKTSFSFNLFSGSVAYYAVVIPYNINGWGAISNLEFFSAP